MSQITPKGSPKSPVWVVVDQPFKNDADKGYLFSSPMGYVWDKMMKEAGFTDYYVKAIRPDLQHPEGYNVVENFFSDINGSYRPPIIIPLGAVGYHFCKELTPLRRNVNFDPDEDSEISKYAGSLLISPKLSFPHYILPTLDPLDIVRQWKERDIVVSCDLAKAATELEYWRNHGFVLDVLPLRTCKIDFTDFDELLADIAAMANTTIISNDIETVYPRDKSVWKNKHPGYPITIGLAPSKSFGISFNLFRDSLIETRELWRVLNNLFKETIQLGQNFFNFDLNFYKMLGFEIDEKRIIDTMIRQKILIPEWPAKLQFMTRQYTREKYYKDEGHGWSLKDMRGLKHYNCLDVCVTYEVYEEQEKCLMSDLTLDKGNVSDVYHTFNELYEHRIILYIALCRQLEEWFILGMSNNEIWKSKFHSDSSSFDGWFIMGINTEKGKQITYHLPNSKWDDTKFAQILDIAPEFDGHTSNDVLERIANLR